MSGWGIIPSEETDLVEISTRLFPQILILSGKPTRMDHKF